MVRMDFLCSGMWTLLHRDALPSGCYPGWRVLPCALRADLWTVTVMAGHCNDGLTSRRQVDSTLHKFCFLKWCILAWWPLALGVLMLSPPPHCVCSYKGCYLGCNTCPIAPVFSGQANDLLLCPSCSQQPWSFKKLHGEREATPRRKGRVFVKPSESFMEFNNEEAMVRRV